MCQQGINFVDYIWSFGDYRPAEGLNRSEEQVPTSTAVSSTISGSLKRQGFKFVGLTIFYAGVWSGEQPFDRLSSLHFLST